MRNRRIAAVLIFAAAGLGSGCTTWSERFHVPGRDPMMTFLGADYDEAGKLWQPATLPDLLPMRTELIPDRAPPPGTPAIGWPPWPPLW